MSKKILISKQTHMAQGGAYWTILENFHEINWPTRVHATVKKHWSILQANTSVSHCSHQWIKSANISVRLLSCCCLFLVVVVVVFIVLLFSENLLVLKGTIELKCWYGESSTYTSFSFMKHVHTVRYAAAEDTKRLVRYMILYVIHALVI